MSIQQRSRSAMVPATPADWPHVSAVLLLAIAIPPIFFLFLVRVPLVLPSVSAVGLKRGDHRIDGVVFVL
jgi:hypothetical protein